MLLVDSFRKRYFSKVLASAFSMFANVITQSIIPRALGAAQYGNFNFLTDFFTQVIAFVNMGSSIGFYTKLSKRPDDRKLVLFYLVFIGLAVTVVLVCVVLIVWVGLAGFLWQNISLSYVYAAVGLAGLIWFFSSINDIADAHALTVLAEMAKVVQRFGVLGLIAVLFFCNWLNLATVFCAQYILMLSGILLLIWIINHTGHGVHNFRLNRSEMVGYVKEFYVYSKPLLWRSLVVLSLMIFDRWFLQREGGAQQQGFYSLSLKIGIICFVLSEAMTQLITREFSIAHHNNDIALMGRIFRRNIPLMYALTTIICCFVASNADKITLIMGGREFNKTTAIIPVIIMAFYPMHQTYGQLSNGVFFATDQTRIYAHITMISMILGVPVAYFLLASPQHYGIGAGAGGLAIKMVLFNVVTNNVLLYFNTKYMKLPFGWYLRHQLMSFIVFLTVALSARFISKFLMIGVAQVFLKFVICGFFYIGLVGAVVYLCPALLGMERQDLNGYLKWRKA